MENNDLRREVERLTAQVALHLESADSMRAAWNAACAEIAALKAKLDAAVNLATKQIADDELTIDNLKAKMAEATKALEQILAWGVKFDAKGVHSQRVIECAAQAVATILEKSSDET